MTSQGVKVLNRAAYGIAAMLIVLPLLEFLLRIWPLRPDELNWRFASVGLLANAVVLPVVGTGLLLLTAAAQQHRLLLRIGGLLCLPGALLMLGASGFFVLDALQLRAAVNPQLTRSYDVATAKTVATFLFGAVIWLWLAVGALWAARESRAAGAKKARASMLVVGVNTRDAGAEESAGSVAPT